MIKISNINDLKEYWQKRSERYDFYKEWYATLPPIIKDILETERIVKPSNLTAQAFKSLYLETALSTEPQFKVDKHCEPVINALCLYATQDAKFMTLANGFSLKKGIMLNGLIGSGKTVLIKILSKNLQYFNDDNCNYHPSFRIIPTYKIIADFGKEGYETISSSKNSTYSEQNIIAFDDLGAESMGMHFGNSVNVLAEIMLQRYDLFKSERSIITHVTTNLDQQHLKEFYGPRLYSRFQELFNVITLTGTDRRK